MKHFRPRSLIIVAALTTVIQSAHAQLVCPGPSESAKINDLTQQVAELNDLKQELRAALRQLKPKEDLVAQR